MAIIQNTSSEVGDVLKIKTTIPVIGIVALQSFLDSTVNETSNRSFSRKFRYSVDGVNWTPLLPLTQANVSQIPISPSNILQIEYYYERVGSDTSETIAWESTTLEGQYTPFNLEGWDNSPFDGKIDYDGVCAISWAISVLEKLYKRGVIPNYITREDGDDIDYISFWSSITHYVALYVCLARYYKNFYTNRELLQDFLSQRDIISNEEDSIIQLQYLMSNLLHIISKRGGNHVFSTQVPDEKYGEFLRLIQFKDSDEFLYSIEDKSTNGFIVDGNCCEYLSISNSEQFNKYYLKRDETIDLSKLPLTNPSNISIVSDSILSKDVIKIIDTGTIGTNSSNDGIVVSSELGYNFSFLIRGINAPTFKLSVYGWDEFGNSTPLLLPTLPNSPTNQIFSTTLQDRYQNINVVLYPNKYFSVFSNSISYPPHCIVCDSGYNTFWVSLKEVPTGSSLVDTNYWYQLSTQELQNYILPNIKQGSNLRLSSGTKYIQFILEIQSPQSGQEIRVVDFNLLPFNNKKGGTFVHPPPIITTVCRNNNKNLSNEEVVTLSTNKILPVHSCFITHFY